MNKLYVYSVFIFLGCFQLKSNQCTAQEKMYKNFEREKYEMHVFKPMKNTDPIKITGVKSGEVMLSFKEHFSDSVVTIINGNLLREDFVQSDSLNLGLSNISFKISVNNKTEILFLLPQIRKYVKFNIDNKYKLVKIFRIGESWKLIKTNYVPEYQ